MDTRAVVTTYYELANAGDWDAMVRNEVRFANAPIQVPSAGYHTLKIWMVDPGITLQKLVLDLVHVRIILVFDTDRDILDLRMHPFRHFILNLIHGNSTLVVQALAGDLR